MDIPDKVIEAIVVRKRNVLLRGKAGTGKSTLIERLKQQLGSRIVITATTGISAYLLNGVTLHSWAGLGLANDTAENLAKKILPSAAKRWKEAKVLVIEEISMLSGIFFDKFSAVGQILRGDKTRAFGGIQLVVVGDFLQLPPVSDSKDKRQDPTPFAFESKHWQLANFEMFTLTHVWRQTDAKFVAALDEIRLGFCSEESRLLLESCVNKELKIKHLIFMKNIDYFLVLKDGNARYVH